MLKDTMDQHGRSVRRRIRSEQDGASRWRKGIWIDTGLVTAASKRAKSEEGRKSLLQHGDS